MKIRKIIFVLTLLLTYGCMDAQSINDSIFNNVVEITANNAIGNETNYLFNKSIPKSIETPIIFVQKEVPINILSTIYPQFSKLIVITPNWIYYNKTSNQDLPEGIICEEPIASSIIYEFNRGNSKISKDSLVIMGGFPKMKFKQVQKLNSNLIEVYHTESFGSTCCPKDPKWKIKKRLDKFISSFESKNNIKLGHIYKKIVGKEGEHILHFTLTNLNKEQKLLFLQEIRYWTYSDSDRKLEDIKFDPHIFTPSQIKKEGLKQITK